MCVIVFSSIFFYFYFCKVGINVLFISVFNNLNLFFLVSITKGFPILLIFSKNQALVLLILSTVFLSPLDIIQKP